MTVGMRDNREVAAGRRSLRTLVFEYLHGFFKKLYVRLWLFWNEMEILFYPYRERLRRNPDTSFLIVAALILFFFKWKHLSVPFFWDEMGAYVEPLHNLYVQGARRLLNSNAFFNHPPGQQLLVWPLYIVFGESIFITRLFSLTCSIFTVYFTYRLGKEFHSRTLGIVASGTLFFMPGFFAQSDMYLGDTILTCFATAYIYFALRERIAVVFVIGLTMGILRENSIAFGAGVLLLVVLRKQLTAKWVLAALSPFLSYVVFLLMQKFQTGIFFTHKAFVDKDIYFSASHFLPAVLKCMRLFFWDHPGAIVVKILAISVPFVLVRRFVLRERLAFPEKIAVIFVFIMLEHIVFFSFDKGLLPRYFYAVMPLFLIMALYPAIVVAGRLSILALPVLMWFFYGYYYGSTSTEFGTGHEYSMVHVDVVEVFRRAAKYMEKIVPKDSVIFVRWPINHVLQSPYMGYVSRAMKVTMSLDDRFDFYVWANNSDGNYVYEKESLVREKKMKLVKHFKYRGKHVEVYTRSGYTPAHKK